MSVPKAGLDFGQLISAIKHLDCELAAQASRAVNTSMTLRNWIFGFNVEDYECQGGKMISHDIKLVREATCRDMLASVKGRILAERMQIVLSANSEPEIHQQVVVRLRTQILSSFPSSILWRIYGQ